MGKTDERRSWKETVLRASCLATQHGRLAALLGVLLTRAAAQGAGPIGLSTTNLPLAWDNSRAVVYSCDPGTLGDRTNGDAVRLVDESFAMWTAVPWASLSTQRGGTLSADVDQTNYDRFMGVRDGVTPIIFDHDGRITDAVLGAGMSNRVLGFAAPEYYNDSTGEIVEGLSVMNGKLLSGRTDNAVKTVLVHEFGHMLGLSHTQLNDQYLQDGNGDNNADIPIMYPILRTTSECPNLAPALTLDDQLSLAYLYPLSDFSTAGGNVAGRVTRDGADFRGANVILRRVRDPGHTAVAWPSGIASRSAGTWEAHLLPGGTYRVEVEGLDPDFTGGSSIGEFDPPPGGVVREYYNGVSESGDPFLDDPSDAADLVVGLGDRLTGINLALNTTARPLELGGIQTGTLFSTADGLPPCQFTVSATAGTRSLTFDLVIDASKSADILVQSGQPVVGSNGNYTYSHRTQTGSGSKSLTISNGTNPPIRAGTYYVALINHETAPLP
ncbi:MAG: hypothetical protein HY815_29270, partial [Candidatus Riflebacteria bacterium]|nr:hypothetical protein [Candidatus Riflebacteria bacterium]